MRHRIHTALGDHIRSLYGEDHLPPPSEAVREFVSVLTRIPGMRGPVQDETQYCDDLGMIERPFSESGFRPLIERSTEVGMAILRGVLDHENQKSAEKVRA